MIEVVIDFNEISFDNDLLKIYKDSQYGHIPKTTKAALIIYLCKKLNIPGVFGWDAFSDNFRDLLYKEWEEYKKEDGWESYEEYLKEKEEDARIGPKNERGVRDDMKLIFVNFRPFLLQHERVACDLLHVMFFRLEEVNSDRWRIEGMMNKVEICIKS